MKKVFTGMALIMSAFAFGQNWTEVSKIVADTRQELAQYGNAVAISDSVMAIAGFTADSVGSAANSNLNIGVVEIYEKDITGSWVFKQYLHASDHTKSDEFGVSLDLHGDQLIVGAEEDTHDENNSNSLSVAGSAYIFERIGGTWTEVVKLSASDRAAGDKFGSEVAIYEDWAAVGAIGEDEDADGLNTLGSAGSIYIYDKTGGSWVFSEKVTAPVRQVADRFGVKFDLWGDLLIAGASFEDHDEAELDSIPDAGSVYVFSKTGGAGYVAIQKLVAPVREAEDNYGAAIGVEGKYLIVGANEEDHDMNEADSVVGAGSAYIYKWNAGQYDFIQKIAAGNRAPGDNFGFAVDIDSNYAVVGADLQDYDEVQGEFLNGAGAVYVFKWNAGTGMYEQQEKIVQGDRKAADRLGFSVSIKGTDVIAGAHKQDFDAVGLDSLKSSGAAYLYRNDNILSVSTTQEIDFEIYPVPAADELNVVGDFTTVKIFTTSGQLIIEAVGRKELDVSALQPGIYVVQATSSDGVASRQFVVN